MRQWRLERLASPGKTKSLSDCRPRVAPRPATTALSNDFPDVCPPGGLFTTVRVRFMALFCSTADQYGKTSQYDISTMHSHVGNARCGHTGYQNRHAAFDDRVRWTNAYQRIADASLRQRSG